MFSLGISPHFENEVWCGIKFGKLIKFDLEREEVLSQNNRAHTIETNGSIPLLFEDGFDINSITPTFDPHVIATGSDDGLIKLWDSRNFSSTCKPIGGFIGHYEGITSIDSCGYCGCSNNIYQLCSNSKD